MTFRDARKTVFYAAMLDTNAFAVTATIRRAGLADASAVVLISREANVSEETLHQERTERAVISIGRDEAHTKGGVAEAEIGLQIIDTTEAAPERPWLFSGEIRDANDYSYQLTCERTCPIKLGKR